MSHELPAKPEPLPAEVFDSHCHLDIMVGNRKASSGDPVALAAQAARSTVETIVADAKSVGVTRLVTIGYDLPSSRWSAAAAEAHPDVYAGVAIHPNEAHSATPEALAEIEELARLPWVRAVGETGLDYYWDFSPPEPQQEAFRWHIDLAKRCGKPLMIHDRDAHEDVLRILEEEGAPGTVIFHCFSGDAEFARACLDAGYVLSFSGTATFRNAKGVREAARICPVEQMLVETDAPFLTPHPYRGRPNEPYCVNYTIRDLAELRGVEPAELAAATTATAERVYGLGQ